MGASTAILFMKDHPGKVCCSVLDSSFSNVKNIVAGMGTQFGFQPSMMGMFYPMIDAAIFKKGGFHLDDLNPGEACKECTEPVIIVHGKSDKFITPSHSETIYANYRGSKDLKMCSGDHNAPRPTAILDEIAGFFDGYLHEEMEEVEDDGLSYLQNDNLPKDDNKAAPAGDDDEGDYGDEDDGVGKKTVGEHDLDELD